MKIIFISHWFPPYNEIGAVRPYQLVRYLANLGHQVTVITSEGNFSPKNYIADISDIDVIRIDLPWITRYSESLPNSLIKKVVKRMFYPDQYVTMLSQMFSVAKSAFGGGADLIISSGLPFSTHVLAKRLAVQFNLPWIADNRDLWANTPYRRQFFGSQNFDLWYERKILQHADACLVIGDGMAQEMKKRLPAKLIETLMNGADCDPADYEFDDYSGQEVTFTYTGTLYKGRRDLSPLLSVIPKLGVTASVNFYGSESFYVNKYSLLFSEVKIKNQGRVSKEEVKKVQRESNFLVLALGNDSFEKTVLTGKFFEYLETCRPIIALCDPEGELGMLIRKYGIGCASRNPEAIYEFIKSVLRCNYWHGRVPYELTRNYQMQRVIPRLINTVCQSRI